MMPESLAASAPAPFLVSWNLTRLCNLACGHCYLDAVQRKHQARDELTTDHAREVVGELAELAPGAMVVFSGGEPLMRRDFATLIETAAARGLVPVVGTNGTLLDEHRARRLKAAGALGVGISLDSAEPPFHDRLRGLQGAWDGAMRGISAARRAGLAILLQSTLFEANRQDLARLSEIAEAVGAVAFNVFFLVCTGRGVTQTDLSSEAYEEALAQIARLQREHPAVKVRARCAPYLRQVMGLRAGESGGGYADWSSACLAGRRYFRITPQGQITPCPYVPEVAGDLREQPLRAIWETHPTFRRLRNELPGGKCGECDYRYSCGGCRARALARHGDVMAEDPKCRHVRPQDRAPEAPPAAARNSGVTWEPEAEERLNRIPAFVREFVKTRVEQHALQQGINSITAEFLAARRPPARLIFPR